MQRSVSLAPLWLLVASVVAVSLAAEGTIYGPSLKETTSPIAVEAVLDANSVPAETREDNNATTATLGCASAPSIAMPAVPMTTSRTLVR